MIARRQLTVASPIAPASLARAFFTSARGDTSAIQRASASIATAFGSSRVVLTDSGTSALVLALRATVPNGGTIALPAYGCVDLVAAALYAGARIRLYDIDPETLSPDLDSLRRTLERGVDAVLVAHLFGYAADVRAVQAIASAAGVPVIEDAAQGAGATLGGARLGSLGELAVLSFGRGKGLCAAGGGALLTSGNARSSIIDLASPVQPKGLKSLAITSVQWALGRPALYAIPSGIPWLHLGETVYHPATEPVGMSLASASLVPAALALEPADLTLRRAHAAHLDALVAESPTFAPVMPIESSQAGYLRYAARDLRGNRTVARSLGIVKPYPGTMAEYSQLRSIVFSNEPATPGASEIARSLFTLPTHRFVNQTDLAALHAWLRAT